MTVRSSLVRRSLLGNTMNHSSLYSCTVALRHGREVLAARRLGITGLLIKKFSFRLRDRVFVLCALHIGTANIKDNRR